MPEGVVSSLGEDAIDLAKSAGLVLDPWQQDILRHSLGVRPNGQWCASECALVLPRQNGKNGVVEARQLAGLFLFEELLAVHSAHEFKTAFEHLLRIKSLIENTPDLERKTRIIMTGSANMSVELRNGQRLRFIARSKGSGRGMSGDTVYLDEAFALTAAQMGALLPTLSAVPNPQLWYFSSAPMYESEFLHSLLKRCGDEGERRLYLAAWENPSGTLLDDVEAWYRVNPALGIRISDEFVANEMRTLCASPEGVAEFQRERLGIREGGDGEAGVVPYDQWVKLVDRKSTVASQLCFGLSVGPDRAYSSISSAGRRSDGLLHVDTVQREAGTAWVVGRCKELYAKHKIPLRLNPAAAEGALIKPLTEARVEVVEVTGREYEQACGRFLVAVVDGGLRHLDQDSMNRSVSAAGRRPVGQEGAWVWGRPGAADISPLTAVSLALSGVSDVGVDVLANVHVV